MSPEQLTELTKKILDLLGIDDATVSVTTGHRTVVAVTTSGDTPLIGANGDHLRALNMLLRRLVEKQHGEKATSFLVDINGYHEAQMEQVRANARVLAQRTRLFKHDTDMEPMTSYERLVVHELFAEDPEIKTESAGEGKFRHIVLKYAKA